jgi:hypothetical protein
MRVPPATAEQRLLPFTRGSLPLSQSNSNTPTLTDTDFHGVRCRCSALQIQGLLWAFELPIKLFAPHRINLSSCNNPPMQYMRSAHNIARFVLVWFALSIGVAIASPLVKPQSMQLICSDSGAMKVLTSNDDGNTPTTGHTLDCLLCAGIGAPPPLVASIKFDPVQPLAYALQSIASAHIVSATAAPLPARGPPSLL